MVALDFLGPLVETEGGNKHVLVVTDKLSKYSIALALPDQTAETTARALFYKVFCEAQADEGKVVRAMEGCLSER